ncbi:MAG: ATP-binding protein [Balneolaceae bacterium]|nr:ATP-binding protein [Balneolaceae bacterium]
MVSNSKLKEAIRAKTETEEIDFKESFDNSSTQDWCEIVKDLVAISNSGDGAIIFGVTDNGSVVEGNFDHIFKIDPAVITDKIDKYTGVQMGGFQLKKLPFQEDTLPELKTYLLPVLHVPPSRVSSSF